MNVELDTCPVCGRMPCYGILMGPDYLTAGCENRDRATTRNGSRSARFYLRKTRILEVYGV